MVSKREHTQKLLGIMAQLVARSRQVVQILTKNQINTDAELSSALLEYAKAQFSAHYNYEFAGTPPDAPKDMTSPYIKHNQSLSYMPDVDQGRLEGIVKNEIIA
jgi:hypothetical protein